MSKVTVIEHFLLFFFFNDTATTEIYTLSLHDALPISSSLSTAVAAAASSPAVTQTPSYSGANPSQRRRERSAWRTSRCSSGMEKAATVHCPDQERELVPNEKMRRAPSAITAAARSVSP